MITVVPATRELIERYTGEVPGPTLRAFVALLDGEPVGVGGVAFHGDCLEVFSDVKPVMKAYPVTIFKVAKAVMGLVAESGLPAYATRNEGECNSDAFLRRLGFEPEGDIYMWRGF